MSRKKILLFLSFVLAASTLFSNAALADTSTTQSTANSIRIATKVVSLTGTIVSKATNDGVAYWLITSSGSFAIIGPNVKSIKSYANTDKKITVTGNPAVGSNIIVMTSFTNYVAAPKATTTPSTKPATTTTNSIRIDTTKVVSIKGTIVSKPTNDGTAYKLTTFDGTSYYIIGTKAASISSYANTGKKIEVTGYAAVGANIIVMSKFSEYISVAPTTTH